MTPLPHILTTLTAAQDREIDRQTVILNQMRIDDALMHLENFNDGRE